MRAPAWWRRFRAWLGGYFWIPCPLCGDFFAGYEWDDDGLHEASIPKDGGWTGRGICPTCTRKGLGERAWQEVLPMLSPEARFAYAARRRSRINKIAEGAR